MFITVSNMVELHLRITTSDYTLEQVESFIKTLSPDKYIVAQEVVPYNHYHSHFSYDISSFTDYQKRKLGKTITDHFNLTDGNKQYGISKDRGRSAIYTVKDGKFVSHGYSEAEIATLYAQSNTKLDFKATLKNLFELVSTREIDFKEYGRRYITAHVESNKPISDFRVNSHFKTVYLMSNPHKIFTYADRLTKYAREDPWE